MREKNSWMFVYKNCLIVRNDSCFKWLYLGGYIHTLDCINECNGLLHSRRKFVYSFQWSKFTVGDNRANCCVIEYSVVVSRPKCIQSVAWSVDKQSSIDAGPVSRTYNNSQSTLVIIIVIKWLLLDAVNTLVHLSVMQRWVVRSPEEESKGSLGRVCGLTDIPCSQAVSQSDEFGWDLVNR